MKKKIRRRFWAIFHKDCERTFTGAIIVATRKGAIANFFFENRRMYSKEKWKQYQKEGWIVKRITIEY